MRKLNNDTNSAPAAIDNACGPPNSTPITVDTRPMMTCGVRRWTRVLTATIITGIVAPIAPAATSITASDDVDATTANPTPMRTIATTRPRTSPSRRNTRDEVTAPTSALPTVGRGPLLYPDLFPHPVPGILDVDARALLVTALARHAAGMDLPVEPLYLRRPDALTSAERAAR